ncbi:MAG TPA: PepSY-associated TM helix domain-containing protein [Kineosporiaceae bacterium]|nr:PepSY-associated TM helix domain-containing protein [Kineosporiaceae bacterium]
MTDVMPHPAGSEPASTPAEPAGTSPARTAGKRPGSAAALRRVLVRLHFYAGVFVAPFLVVAALTGLAFVLTPQIDNVAYGGQLTVSGQVTGTPLPLAQQVAAARAAHPEGSLAAVITPDDAGRTTQVVLAVPELGDKQRTVYVNPYSGRVQGDLVTWFGETPTTTWLDDLHRNLHLYDLGRSYSELAASWLWVLVLGGLVLWIARRRQTGRVRRTVLPDLGARGRRRTMGWHGATGVWVAVGLLFLSATGLTWSRFAGERFTAVLDGLHAHAPQLDTTLAPHPEAPVTATSADVSRLPFDQVLAAARAAGYDGPVEIDLPTDDSGSVAADTRSTAWAVTQNDHRWPVRLGQVAIDPVTFQVVSAAPWSSFPLLAQLTKLGVAGHMGLLFGPVNQVLLAGLALGLLCLIVWGYRMWWQRRPTRDDRRRLTGPAPARGSWRDVPRPLLVLVVVVVAAVGWAIPLLGVSLLGFLAVDVVLGAAARYTSRRAARTAVG